MPVVEEEEEEQALWQSVVLFCCKGMIEGIIVTLFLWLLIQVLFTKELEIHLQVLLGVGLVVFCLSLLLGCFLCLWRMRSLPAESKEPPGRPGDNMTSSASARAPTSSSSAPPMRVLNEEPEGGESDYPSAFGSSTPSDDNFCVLPLATLRRPSSPVLQGESTSTSCLPLRRLSSPQIPAHLLDRPRPSLPALPRLGFLWRTRRVLERRCTVTADTYLDSERSRLLHPSQAPPTVGPTPSCSRTRTLAKLSRFRTESSLPRYGSASTPFAHSPSPIDHTSSPIDPAPSPLSPAPSPPLRSPSLHFSLCFSPARHTLTLSLISLSGATHRLGSVSVLACLPPVQPDPSEAVARHRSLSPQLHGPVLVLPVASLELLRTCVLHLDIFAQDLPGHSHAPLGHAHSPLDHAHSPLGHLEITCADISWQPDVALTCRGQLSLGGDRKQGGPSHDATGVELVVSNQVPPLTQVPPPAQPQLFILLQHQTLAHRIKVMVLKAENLTGTGTQEHHVVVNLRLDGVVVHSCSTGGAAGQDGVWNSPFLFDLPPGDPTQLPLLLEFLLIKGRIYSTSNVVGRAVIGQQAEEAGQAHWNDMCNRSQVEVTRWHVIQSEAM